MKPQNLKDRTKKYAIAVLKYLDGIPKSGPYYSITNQITRASMSVGPITVPLQGLNLPLISLISLK